MKDGWKPYIVSLWRIRVSLIDGQTRWLGALVWRRRNHLGAWEYRDPTEAETADDVYDKQW